MIISASRRTDIPAFYSQWFLNRLKDGYVMVRNPMNYHRISRVSLSPEVVDGIVFWTKNPAPMLDKLDALKEYPYYFQFTLNAYGQDVERWLPAKSSSIIPTFLRLSEKIGPERVIWRYDPIFLSDAYPPEYHVKYFEELAKRLSGHTKRCVISFLDWYKRTEKHMAALKPWAFPPEEQQRIAKAMAEIARGYGLELVTCAEQINLSRFGISHGHCIDGELLEKLSGFPLKLGKDPNQRKECGCVESIDVGAYNTCRHGCLYCYATFNDGTVSANMAAHDPESPLLYGEVGPEDVVTQRETTSNRVIQTFLEGMD